MSQGHGPALEVVQVPRRFTTSDWGGTETAVLQTCQRLGARGVATEIYTSRALNPRPHEVIGGVAVERFGYFYPYFGLGAAARAQLDRKGGNLVAPGLAWRLARRPRLDLVHLHTGKRLGGLVRTVARLRRIPYVISLHGGLLDVPEGEASTLTAPARGAFEWGRALGLLVGARRVVDDAAAVVCVGRAEAAQVAARWPRKRVEVVPNGVDVARFATGDGARFRAAHGIAPGERVVLCVARLDPQKNQRALVAAVARLAGRIDGVRLVLIGPVTTPSYRAEVEADARAAGVALTLIPGLPPDSRDLVDAHHAADVCALASVHEPFGIAVLEAWAAGRPVVASRVGGIPGFVRDGADALLVEPGDASALSGALARVLEEPGLAGALARVGRTRAADEFDWDRCADRLAALYREVVDAHPVRA